MLILSVTYIFKYLAFHHYMRWWKLCIFKKKLFRDKNKGVIKP